ncbi:MAG: SURF1 family protein [Sulfuricella sp.]|nr:SURF1 family protein [Sulfuricella sp.]
MAIYRFRPKRAPTLATLALLPVLVQLGLWQWHKAEAKREFQRRADAAAQAAPLPIGPRLVPEGEPRQGRVALRGRYEARYQFLLDNQINGEQAGYDVLTPLRIEGGDIRVLVNRGWVPLGRSRDVLPRIDPPPGEVEVTGTVWQPPRPRFAFPEPVGRTWQPVRQSVDLARYRTEVPFALQPFVVRLDPAATGCYACVWPRADERVGMHRGYAFQWFGMAAVLAVFYLAASVERDR